MAMQSRCFPKLPYTRTLSCISHHRKFTLHPKNKGNRQTTQPQYFSPWVFQKGEPF